MDLSAELVEEMDRVGGRKRNVSMEQDGGMAWSKCVQYKYAVSILV